MNARALGASFIFVAFTVATTAAYGQNATRNATRNATQNDRQSGTQNASWIVAQNDTQQGHGDAGHSSGHSSGEPMQSDADAMPSFKLGDLVISQAHTRVTPPGATVAGGYLTITNNGATDDTLIGGSAEFAKITEVHSMEMVDDVMKMRRLKAGLPIPAGATVKLAHGGYHLMFKHLTSPLSMDDELSVTLEFETAGELEIPLSVVPLM